MRYEAMQANATHPRSSFIGTPGTRHSLSPVWALLSSNPQERHSAVRPTRPLSLTGKAGAGSRPPGVRAARLEGRAAAPAGQVGGWAGQ